MNGTKKKGTTLAELCVVLGLVVIIGTMVVSFSVMMSHRISLSAARLEVISDIELVESITETWLGRMKLLGAEPLVRDQVAFNELYAIDPVTEEEYTLSYNGEKGVLKGTLPNEEVLTFTPNRVLFVEFMDCEADYTLDADTLFFYTLVCDLPGMGGGKEQYQQTFFVNPRVGDTYGSGGGAS